MSSLQGADQLRARLRAIRKAGQPMANQWAVEAAKRAKAYAPRKTGRLRSSIRPTAPTGRGRVIAARVVGMYYGGAMMRKGTKAHDVPRSRFTKAGRLRRGKAAGTGKVLKFVDHGVTIFRRKVHHRGTRPNDYASRALRESLSRAKPLQEVIKLWNGAA